MWELFSLFKNDNMIKNSEIGITKNNIPPHEESARDKNRPANESFNNDDFPL